MSRNEHFADELADFAHPDFDVSVLHNGGHFLTVEAVRKKKR